MHRFVALLLVSLLGACASTPPPKPKVTPPKAKVAQAKPKAPPLEFAVPEGFVRKDEASFAMVTAPEAALRTGLFSRPEADLAQAVVGAWKLLSPAFDAKPKDVMKPPAKGDPYTTTVVCNYQLGKDQIFRQAIAHRYKDFSYVLLLEGPLALVKKRGAQLREIFGSALPQGVKRKTLAAADAKTPTAAQLAALKTWVENAREKVELPGIAFALVQDGKLLTSFGAGTTKVGGGKPVTDKTHMMIGSITKSFTALMIAKLVAQKKLSWTMPATELDKSFRLKSPEQTASVQLQHLLCACTGVPRRDLPLLFEFEKARPEGLLRDLRTMEFLTKFGETFQYSNQLVAAAGFMVAKKLGRGRGLAARYQKLLRKVLLDPLGMKDTRLDLDAVRRLRHYSMPHSETITGKIVAIDLKGERFATPLAPAGALWSTAADFSKLLIALTSKEPNPALPPAAQLAELWRPRAKVGARGSYGLGWMTLEYKGLPVHAHGGGTLGFRSYFAYMPAARLGWVILTNGSRGGALLGLISQKVQAMAFGQKDESDKLLAFILKRIPESIAKLNAEVGEEVPAARLKKLVGRYDGGELGLIKISKQGKRALLDTGALKMAFLPKKKAPKAETYVLVEPPLTGISFWVEEKDGKPELHFEPNSVHYVAKKKR